MSHLFLIYVQMAQLQVLYFHFPYLLTISSYYIILHCMKAVFISKLLTVYCHIRPSHYQHVWLTQFSVP